jgi:flavodoxin
MNAIVVYESVYGNTRAVAEAIAEGLGEVPVLSVHEAAPLGGTFDLLVVGGPTHIHGMATDRSRQVAVDAAEKDGASHIDPHATDGPGLRAWLRDLVPDSIHHAAAFDTRLDRSMWFTGTAARGIAKRLTRRGIDVADTASFLVTDSEGPLEAGELERARAWGAKLAQSLTAVRQETLARV